MVTGEESLLLMCLVAFAHGEYWSFLSKTTIKNPCQNQLLFLIKTTVVFDKDLIQDQCVRLCTRLCTHLHRDFYYTVQG
jgi:hypothetical protein